MDDAPNIAIFCDYENLAIGAKEASYDDFDISLALERLLDKGKIVVKKAYSDWERYKGQKRKMHEAAFELIEIPHVSYSGKNSADIRLVVDALDLCYTKSHVDTFVILSGDSDFSPLVSKLRENNKRVIGLGIKDSSSDLLIENCDEFIYYDDLVRKQRQVSKRSGRGKKAAGGRRGSGKKPEGTPTTAPPPAETPASAETEETRDAAVEEAMELVLDTVEALFQEREDAIWGSMVKQTLKRKRPTFNENFYGFRTFNQLLVEAERRGLLEMQKDEKSGGYLITAFGPNA
ncbi:MAG: NYN domain-containing protein [Deltaproteobacteria bacterium]|nr:NYN domain-containing protein [Deltaproteobacteria bacterium]